MRRTVFLLFLLLVGNSIASSQDLPPCAERTTSIDFPWVDGSQWCLEEVIIDDSARELSFTALATAPDGTLYAARPLAGQVMALDDTNGDGLPDQPRVAAEGLTLPNGLAYYDGALYISGGTHVYRLTGDGLETLVEDLPAGGGFWTGGITIGPDERIYVGTGAACDYCLPTDPARGAILSFALDGTDRQILATGLRQPNDLTFLDGNLWTVDTARDALSDTPDLDELDRFSPGANFGWPYCIGIHNQPDLEANFDCESATAPALTFPTHSTPLGMAAYNSDTFPSLTGKILVALSGNYNEANLRGFSVAAVSFGQDGRPMGYETIIPAPENPGQFSSFTDQTIHYINAGFWPHRPLDVAVSTEGWVYISVGGGRILALRPRE